MNDETLKSNISYVYNYTCIKKKRENKPWADHWLGSCSIHIAQFIQRDKLRLNMFRLGEIEFLLVNCSNVRLLGSQMSVYKILYCTCMINLKLVGISCCTLCYIIV